MSLYRNYADWQLIDEEAIENAANLASQNDSSELKNFQKILDAGEVFRYVGLTPVFVYDAVTARMAVYASEFHDKSILLN
jgi:hypothetical protein